MANEVADTPSDNRWRPAMWGGAALLLLLPLVAMQFTREVIWDAADFAIFGTMLVDRPSGRRWWSPTFCGVCKPEERNNENLLVKGSYFLSAGDSSHPASHARADHSPGHAARNPG